MKTTTQAMLIATTLTLGACGGGEDDAAREAAEEAEKQTNRIEKKVADGTQDLENALNKMAQAFGGEDGEKVDTVSARTLKEMLPEKLGKLPRSSFSSQKNGAMGFNVTTAEAVYSDGSGGPSVMLEISDIGAMQGLASLGMNWMNMEIDEESDKGFRRSTEYKGHRAFQNFSKSGNHTEGDMSVFVNGRFVVKVSGRNVPFEKIEEAVKLVPIEEFEKLSEETGKDSS